MSFTLSDWSIGDFLTGHVGGALSVGFIAYLGRYISGYFVKKEDRNLVGFCLALGLFFGGGTVVNGSAQPESVELFGRACGSLGMLSLIWYLWFKRQADVEQGKTAPTSALVLIPLAIMALAFLAGQIQEGLDVAVVILLSSFATIYANKHWGQSEKRDTEA